MTAFQAMKQGNCTRILQILRNRPHSRAELARQTGLTRATITGLVDGLIAAGLVCEGEIASASKGRKPTLLRLSPHAATAIGVDISDRKSVV